jgi:hypothetical protein
VSSAGSDRRRAVDVYLARDAVATLGTDGVLWHGRCGSAADGMQVVGAQLRGAGSPKALRVWLSGALCRPVRLAAIAGKLTRAECLQLWESAARTASGLEGSCSVMFDAGRDGESVVAVVVEEATLEAIADASRSLRARIASIRPWWAEAQAAALRANAGLRAFAAWEGAALTMLVGDGSNIISAQTMYPIDDVDAATAAFARGQVSAMVSSAEAAAIALDWSPADPGVAGSDGGNAWVFAPWATPLEGAR